MVKSIALFGKVVKIEYKDLARDEDIDGEYKPKERRIYIDKSLRGEEQLHTLLHEVGHALFHRMGWNQAVPSEVEEIIVDTYATMLLENFNIRTRRKR